MSSKEQLYYLLLNYFLLILFLISIFFTNWNLMNKLDFSISDPVALRETILAKATIFLKEMSSPS